MKDHNGNANDMIANIFGMHLGCEMKLKKGNLEVEKVLTGKLLDYYTHWNRFNLTLKDCKLLLKPLSSISEEDKREFFTVKKRRSCLIEDLEELELYISRGGYVMCTITFTNEDYGKHARMTGEVEYQDMIWLASRGFDVGIVPDEYKEVRG